MRGLLTGLSIALASGLAPWAAAWTLVPLSDARYEGTPLTGVVTVGAMLAVIATVNIIGQPLIGRRARRQHAPKP